MGASITATVLAFIALGIAYVVMRQIRLDPGRGLVLWALCAVVYFFLHDFLLILLLTGALMLVLAPMPPAQRAGFFLVCVPSVPFFVATALPFPGINFLAILVPHLVASVAVLVPLLLVLYARPAGGRPRSLTVVDLCVVGYAVFMTLMVIQAINFTSGLRFFVEQCAILILPYFAVSRAIDTEDDLETVMRWFLVASIILASVAFVATAKQWDFYRMFEPGGVTSLPDYRGGWLRIAATSNTHSLGFHLAAALLLLEHLKHRLQPGFLRLNALRALLLIGVLSTGSRGALSALAVGYPVYIVFTTRNTAVRALFLAMSGIGAVVAGFWLMSDDAVKYDPYGTFDYRRRLLTVSLGYIRDHFWVGDINFTTSGYFNSLIQGQGIIDITNLYLQVILNYGIVGFATFFTIFIGSAISMMACALRRAGEPLGTASASVAAAIAAWLMLVVTTSDAGLTVHLGLFLAALARAAAPLAAANARPARDPALPGAVFSR